MVDLAGSLRPTRASHVFVHRCGARRCGLPGPSADRPLPYKSLLTEGCLANGRDINDRGATYDYHESMPMGIPNVADSLAAIEQLVFCDGKLSLKELVSQMAQDYPDESLRQAMLNRAPKYGNDDDAVDNSRSRVRTLLQVDARVV